MMGTMGKRTLDFQLSGVSPQRLFPFRDTRGPRAWKWETRVEIRR